MNLNEWLNEKVPAITSSLNDINKQYIDIENSIGFVGRDEIYKILDKFHEVLFPGIYTTPPIDEIRINIVSSNKLREAALDLRDIIEKVLIYNMEDSNPANCETYCREQADQIVMNLIARFPTVRKVLQTDIQAAYNGDPAALSTEEILLSYPSIVAMFIHRIAHELYEMGVQIVPRIMSEHAHRLTGIDIHPGATIGESFFIDHGTGVVIGETCTIGRNVKVYQGVTLGALSFPLDANGNPIKGIKRHPNIEDNVVIYAGATILGGDTTIGHDSVLGSNIWLTHSVPPYSRVYNSQPSPNISNSQMKNIEYHI
ncbi:serine acetyltransferase [Metasolibacillus meyeri]|uniref:Serine acetyltransferase n=1 Tax=Metasolibacillus meyeri TaxID=1071052 RepID=A0AAW9NTP4_9BACL|nr:serine O-acetyltransferase EpsC [Metasolibacillus meyeri]MEC1178091.1 serine acetyltransferase [Metasolibacillus meyeri]